MPTLHHRLTTAVATDGAVNISAEALSPSRQRCPGSPEGETGLKITPRVQLLYERSQSGW